MTTFLSKSVVLTLATLLVLPTGWCCRVATHEMGDAGPAKTECCQHSSPEQSGEKLPATPDVECCCSHDAAIPAKAVELSDTPTVALTAVIASGDLNLGTENGFNSAVALFDSGPKLHVLQCVWRC